METLRHCPHRTGEYFATTIPIYVVFCCQCGAVGEEYVRPLDNHPSHGKARPDKKMLHGVIYATTLYQWKNVECEGRADPYDTGVPRLTAFSYVATKTVSFEDRFVRESTRAGYQIQRNGKVMTKGFDVQMSDIISIVPVLRKPDETGE